MKKPIFTILALCLFSFFSLAYGNQSGSVKVQIEEAISSGRYLLTVPANTIPINSDVYLSEKAKPVDANYYTYLSWPLSGASEKTQFIRVLEVQFKRPPAINKSYLLSWQANTSDARLKSAPSQKSKSGVMKADDRWMSQGLLLHPENKGYYSDWYTYPQSRYADFVTDVEYLSQNRYPIEKPSQWLYDRPQALYQLYAMTGDYEWKIKADYQSSYYQEHIDDAGFFAHKAKDIKYLNGRGLLFRYMLVGDEEARNALHRMFKASLSWNPEYDTGRGFFTERHQAAALGTALAYWEASLDRNALSRIEKIVDATYKMTFDSRWPNRKCPQHTLRSHEGKGGDSAVCSPWMMALLADHLWRYHRISGSEKSAELIRAFGSFILNRGVYYGTTPRLQNTLIPKYLVALDDPLAVEANQWSDINHRCDIAALLGKSAYLDQRSEKPNILLVEIFDVFAQRCRTGHIKSEKLKKVVMKPPRKFGWEYSSTSDLPWLVEELLDWKGLSRYNR